MKHKRKRPGKSGGMNYADVLKSRRDRLQLAMDEARRVWKWKRNNRKASL